MMSEMKQEPLRREDVDVGKRLVRYRRFGWSIFAMRTWKPASLS